MPGSASTGRKGVSTFQGFSASSWGECIGVESAHYPPTSSITIRFWGKSKDACASVFTSFKAIKETRLQAQSFILRDLGSAKRSGHHSLSEPQHLVSGKVSGVYVLLTLCLLHHVFFSLYSRSCLWFYVFHLICKYFYVYWGAD